MSRVDEGRTEPAPLRPQDRTVPVASVVASERFRRLLAPVRREQPPVEALADDALGPPPPVSPVNAESDDARQPHDEQAARYRDRRDPHERIDDQRQDRRRDGDADGSRSAAAERLTDDDANRPPPVASLPAWAPIVPGTAPFLVGDPRTDPSRLDSALGFGAEEPPTWMRETLHLAHWLARHADVLHHQWTATVPLDRVLADSEVVVRLSPYGLTLRFRAGSADAANLIFRHRGRLKAELARLPSLPVDIDIELE